MQHDWVLDVLVDLQAFARANGLTELDAQLTLVCLKVLVYLLNRNVTQRM